MGIEVNWHNAEKTIMHYTYTNRWTWEEFYSKIQEGNTLMDEVAHPVVSLIDMRDSRMVPQGAIVHLKRIIEISAAHNNTNISVFVGANQFHQMLVDTARKLYRDIDLTASFHFVQDLEAGEQLAAEIQQTLT